MKKIVIGILLASLVGCASTSWQDKIHRDNIKTTLVRGKTTDKEVLALIGKPNSADTTPSGESWLYVADSGNGFESVPLLGAAVALGQYAAKSGSDASSPSFGGNVLRLSFNAKGVLTDWGISSSNSRDSALNRGR